MARRQARRLTVRELIDRFDEHAHDLGGRRCLPIVRARKLIAAATEAELTVMRIFCVAPHGASELLYETGTPRVRASWAEVVFFKNGAALAEVERIALADPRLAFAVELTNDVAYFSSRDHSVPMEERSDDEVRWRYHSLSSALGLAASHGVVPTEDELADLDALRAELERRG